MRVLVVHTNYQERGGEDVVVEAETALLRSRGVEVTEFMRSNDSLAGMNPLAVARTAIWNSSARRDLRDTLRQVRPSVVHVHNTFPSLSPAVLVTAAEEGIPVVQTLHNFRLICPNALLLRDGKPCELCVGRSVPLPAVRHACYRGSLAASAVASTIIAVHNARGTWIDSVTLFVALSDFSKSLFVRGGLPAERIRVKPNFVAPDPGVGAASGSYVLFVGRLSGEKGIGLILEAWSGYGDRLPPIKIVGSGPEEPRVRAAAARMPNVSYLGPLARDDVFSLMKDAQLLVMPTLCYENMSMVILEAAACGLPAIASNIGTIPGIVIDRSTGVLFAPGSTQDLAEKLLETIANRQAMARMRVAARKWYLENFTPDRAFMQTMSIYEEAVRIGSV